MDLSSIIPPIGEEGFAVSHGGGEMELYEELGHALSCQQIHIDDCDRHDHTARLVYAWADQYEALHPSTQVSQLPKTPFQYALLTSSQGVFSHCLPHINVSLMTRGCIGSSPLQPTVAITIRTLEAYRQMHRVCLRLSIHAEVKKLCHLHGVHYGRYLAKQFRVAYDIYLELLRRVSLHVSQALGHTGPNWCACNSCPCCHYKVQDEPKLRFPFEIALDGNNSAKFVDPALRGGNIWIDEEYVDRFKDEVKNTQHSHCPNTLTPADIDSNEPVNICVDRWRNATPEARKRMFSVFQKSGIFVAVCHHGFLLSICDMVRSGEL
ncbi:uncharacterized protein EDB91DRAFT_1237656 [Suillus paluster]|uniref:uncharacterized protein n=1 Tax=Suillus paluster TaxID=48578 RepID=UPI001B85BE30|nr:uncharacterized protein EDB91DRAFT_1237656 [Suillus paluster]KAG1738873.1 hypothetical protein EDB91DRAFT_1237656 [Suillus paluster]